MAARGMSACVVLLLSRKCLQMAKTPNLGVPRYSTLEPYMTSAAGHLISKLEVRVKDKECYNYIVTYLNTYKIIFETTPFHWIIIY